MRTYTRPPALNTADPPGVRNETFDKVKFPNQPSVVYYYYYYYYHTIVYGVVLLGVHARGVLINLSPTTPAITAFINDRHGNYITAAAAYMYMFILDDRRPTCPRI